MPQRDCLPARGGSAIPAAAPSSASDVYSFASDDPRSVMHLGLSSASRGWWRSASSVYHVSEFRWFRELGSADPAAPRKHQRGAPELKPVCRCSSSVAGFCKPPGGPAARFLGGLSQPGEGPVGTETLLPSCTCLEMFRGRPALDWIPQAPHGCYGGGSTGPRALHKCTHAEIQTCLWKQPCQK